MFAGVDVGGSKILCRLVDPESGWATGRAKASTPKTGPNDVLSTIVSLLNALDPEGKAEGIGVGLPGLVSPDGSVARCSNIAGWNETVAVASKLEQATGKPVRIGNDGSFGTLGEHRCGAGRGHNDMIGIFVGTGVGGGLILDGNLRTGANGLAGEVGHLVVESGGRSCPCGGRGHLEAYVGKTSIENEARRLERAGQPSLLVDTIQNGSLKSRHLEMALAAGDEVTRNLMNQAADALAQVIGNLTTLLDVTQVVVGGGVLNKLGQEFLDQITQSDNFGGLGPDGVELRLAHRIDDAVAVGAALYCHERVCQ